MINKLIIPLGNTANAGTKTFTVLLPASNERHFIECNSCNTIEAHDTMEIIRGNINHRCKRKTSIHPLLEPYITDEMIELEHWTESTIWKGYCVSNLGRIMNTKKEYILSPTNATEEGRVYYVVRSKSISNLEIVQEYLRLENI